MKIFERTPERNGILTATHFALTSTCQLYQHKGLKSEFFDANGCAILLENESGYYCLSNAHVLSDSQLGRTFFLLRDGMTMTVAGQIFYTKLPQSNKRKDDFFDISVVKLKNEVAIALIEDGYKFLNVSNIRTGVNLTKDDILLIAAYPASKTKFNLKTKRLDFNPIVLRTIPFLKDLRKVKYPKEFHHLVEYPIGKFKQSTTAKKMRAPNPHGISGSGLWLLEPISAFEFNPILIGILTEYHENRAILISTKVDLYISILNQKFDTRIQNNGPEVEIL